MRQADRRSSSCPDLSTYRQAPEPFARRRAHSVFCHVDDIAATQPFDADIQRVQSDSNLNRNKRSRAMDSRTTGIQADDLIARVFNALGNVKVAEEEIHSISNLGFHGLSDSQILSSENQNPRMSIPYSEPGYAVPPLKTRGRAASDFRAPIKNQLFANKEHEWTWCGDEPQIAEFMRIKKLNERKSKDLYRASFAMPPPFIINMDEPAPQNTPISNGSPSLLQRLNPFKRSATAGVPIILDPSCLDSEPNASHIPAASFSRKQSVNERRPSTFSIFSSTDENSANVLENTTIADLIRALETMHTQAVIGPPLFSSLLGAADQPRSGVPTESQFGPSMNLLSPTMSSSNRLRDRRVSMLPYSSHQNTPLSNRAIRRQSMFMENSSSPRRSSVLSARLSPPPYTESLTTAPQRRFSVRPTLLSVPPGQSTMPSIQVTSSVQRKITSRPSPLLTDHTGKSTSQRFNRSISNTSSSYSSPPMEALSQSRTHNNLLTPVDESQFNFPRQRRPSQPDGASTGRKRSDSK